MSGLLPHPAALRALAASARCTRSSSLAPAAARRAFPCSSAPSSSSVLRSLSTSALGFQRVSPRPTAGASSSSAAAGVSSAPPSAGSFFAQSYLPYSSRGSFFTPSRYVSTSAAGAGAADAGAAAPQAGSAAASPGATSSGDGAQTEAEVRTIPRSLPIWLFGCSALVFGIIVIGGLTRLTESGLSIVEWNPITGIRPPITAEEWDAEWDKYKLSPEGIMMNANITRNEFKKIFYMEWGHRIAGRALGVLFVLPAIYYCTRYKLPRGLPLTLAAIGLGIAAQGALGWYMVASGLKQEIVDNNEHPRVSQYRLAAHLSAALALYIGMVYTAVSLRRDERLASLMRSGPEGAAKVNALVSALNSPAVRKFRVAIGVLGVMVFCTAVTGAFVAGLDAGLVYNEFPMMGNGLAPPVDELLDPRYAKAADKSDIVWRNAFENPVTAQFNHRVAACVTATLLIVQHLVARRPVLRLGPNALPRATQRWSAWTAAAAMAQVGLGISTLIYLVPIPLAAAHQAGAAVVLTCIMGLAGSMRRPGRAVEALRRALKEQQKRG